MSERDDSSAAKEIIDIGSEIAGGVTTATAGLLIAGPAGALAGAAGGPLLIRALRWAGQEARERLLSQREQVRLGGALAFAAEEIKDRLDEGQELRDDGFFTDEVAAGRTTAQEVLEGTLVAAERSYEENKIKYLGKLYGSIAFDSAIDRATANYLLTVGNELTWNQYVVLNVLSQNHEGALGLRESMFPPEGQAGLIQLAHEMYDLAQRAFLSQQRPDQTQGEVILNPVQLAPALLRVQGGGSMFFTAAKLWEMPPGDWTPVARSLGSTIES